MAETLAAGNSAVFQFDPDDYISITGNAQVIASGRTASVNTATSGAAIFGPYPGGASVRIVATGTVSYTLTQPTKLGATLQTVTDASSGAQTISTESLKALANSGVDVLVDSPVLSAIGDSRIADMLVAAGTRRTNGRSWINWANCYLSKTITINGCYGLSGKRSDEFLAESNFANILNDSSNIAVIGYPFANDIGQAYNGYTDADGNVITLANMLDIAIPRIQERVRRLVAAGKFVIVCTETGTANAAAIPWTTSQLTVLYEANRRIRAAFSSLVRVRLFDPVNIVWAATTSATSLVFKTGMSGDYTHATTRQGQMVGKYAAETLFPTIIQKRKRYGVDLSTATQLFANTGYATLTGGTTVNVTGTDAVPANCRVGANTAGSVSYTLTSAAAADGSGNEITLTLTATGAMVAHFTHQNLSVSGALYTDQWVAGVDAEVVSASNCRVYLNTQLFTSQGTETAYDLYASVPADVWLVNGATGPLRMQNLPSAPPAGSSSGLAPDFRVMVDFTAAGSAVIKLKDPAAFRVAAGVL